MRGMVVGEGGRSSGVLLYQHNLCYLTPHGTKLCDWPPFGTNIYLTLPMTQSNVTGYLPVVVMSVDPHVTECHG